LICFGGAGGFAQCHLLKQTFLAENVCMTTATASPNPQQVLDLFERITTGEQAWEQSPAGKDFTRQRIYTLNVVIWLMMLQRLLPKFTLAHAVQHFALRRDQQSGGSAKPISLRPGAYCRARKKLPTMVATQVFDLIADRLSGWLPKQQAIPNRAVFVLDGSTLSLPHSAELKKAYPPSKNQHAESHWPIIRLVVAQDVQTGLALRPEWGPYRGSESVSEQDLAIRALPHLPPEAVVMGDRNFGVFGVAYHATQQHHTVLLRLTQVRAQQLAKGPLSSPSDQPVTWLPTRFDQCGRPHPPQAAVCGRLVCLPAHDPKAKEPLYFFTTGDWSVEQIGQLYALRWNVETDLRSIKQTVQLQQLTAHSKEMLEKELLLALAAYNLVRAVICLAAEKIQVPPRRLSFTNVYTLVETFSSQILAAPTRAAQEACWQHIVSLATQYRLPVRSKRRSFPRSVWQNNDKRYPAKHDPPSLSK
jgi:putative transposase